MARRMRLSDRNVAQLRVEKAEYTVWDTHMPNLGVRVRPSGPMPRGSGRSAFSLRTVPSRLPVRSDDGALARDLAGFELVGGVPVVLGRVCVVGEHALDDRGGGLLGERLRRPA